MVIKILTRYDWLNLKSETHNTVLAILDAVDILVKSIRAPDFVSGITPVMCAGLFSHAIEEYGKLLYLKSLSPNNDKVEIDYDKKFKNHKYKFEFALDVLPERCTVIHKGGFGKNFGKGFDIDTLADWETRLNIFNTDFYDNGRVISYPSVDLDRLTNVVSEFRNAIYATIPV